MSMSRAEHLQWSKDRANEYLDKGDILQGVTSMMSDMGKHEGIVLDESFGLLLMGVISKGDIGEAKRFVDGFN